ncbi:MAG: hypothetical protein KJ941_12805 [Bacteroidetes bacterium]|nr:hypothetical protein [Bacteroidota bacterium]
MKANSSKKIIFEEAGNYTINSVNKSSTFTVSNAPKTEFEMTNEDEFINGVPTINVAANHNTGVQSWYVKGTNLKYSGSDAQIHLFNEGKYEIVLTTIKNGCEFSTSKVVSVREDYNLLAPSGFRPMDSDVRTKTFMPFALKERKTPFQLIIIDPRDGHILFQSNDENMGWDGMDKKTGKLVSNNTNYLWKVNLEKPLKGEKNNYSGSVTIVY